jgi:hypothetical protein
MLRQVGVEQRFHLLPFTLTDNKTEDCSRVPERHLHQNARRKSGTAGHAREGSASVASGKMFSVARQPGKTY